MSKRPDVSVRVRCHGCKKIFVVNLVKERDIPDDKKVEMMRPCPYCGEENAFEVAGNVVKADTLYRAVREVVEGKRSEG